MVGNPRGMPKRTTMSTIKWTKVYKGPFGLIEARKLARELREASSPTVNQIYDVRVRMRPKMPRGKRCVCTAACGAGFGHNERFDIYIKTLK